MGVPVRFLASKLANKSLLHVHGRESLPYLQTFLTNDIRHVTPGSGKHCLYSHIINSMGRTLADVFVYQPTISAASVRRNLVLAPFYSNDFDQISAASVRRNLVLAPFYSNDFGQGGLETDQVILECSKSVAGGLQRTLFAMKIRKKVTIEPMPDKQVWVIFPESCSRGRERVPESCSRGRERVPDSCSRERERVLPTLLQVSSEVLLVSDPRLTGLGYRLIVPSSWKIDSIRKAIGSKIEVSNTERPDTERPDTEVPRIEVSESTISESTIFESTISEYERHRYRMGVSEGAREHAEGDVFPLECNADLLNGVSMKKGMFCGDWITGRNYRKGVMSRIVPFELESSDMDQLQLVAPDSTLVDPSTNQMMGEIRARRGNIGLASLSDRFLERNRDISFTHSSTSIRGRSWIPKWWPDVVQRVNERNIPDGRRNSSIIPESQR